ncbi:hypothetical protein N7454_004239 [Penicillium verhagenii]|nr:hypothetical protein N7454_004239 [Penicillium verhagenii]
MAADHTQATLLLKNRSEAAIIRLASITEYNPFIAPNRGLRKSKADLSIGSVCLVNEFDCLIGLPITKARGNQTPQH